MLKADRHRDIILTGNIRKALVKLALPVILGNAIFTLYQVTDMYWVSRLADGDNAVAAINFVWPLIFLTIAFGIGICIAGNSIVSQFVGMKNAAAARKVAGQLVSFSFMLSFILGMTGLLWGKDLLALLGAEGAMLEYGWQFTSVIFGGMPAMFVFFAFQSIMYGQGDTLTPMLLSGSAVVLNIILDPIFMFTFNMGMAGAAWATVVSRTLATLAGMYLLFFADTGIRPLFSDLRFNRGVLKIIVRVGLPAGVGYSVEGFGFMLLNVFVLGFGSLTVAAFGIGNKIDSLVLLPAMGIGAALAAVVGQNLGADQADRAVQAVKESIKMTVTALAVGGLALVVMAPSLLGIFSNNPVVLEQGIFYMRLIGLSLPLMGIFQSFLGAFQGSGHTVTSMLLTAGRLWVLRIPLILLLKNFISLAERSVWFAMVGSNVLICMIAFAAFLHGGWKRKVVRKDKDYAGEWNFPAGGPES